MAGGRDRGVQALHIGVPVDLCPLACEVELIAGVLSDAGRTVIGVKIQVLGVQQPLINADQLVQVQLGAGLLHRAMLHFRDLAQQADGVFPRGHQDFPLDGMGLAAGLSQFGQKAQLEIRVAFAADLLTEVRHRGRAGKGGGPQLPRGEQLYLFGVIQQVPADVLFPLGQAAVHCLHGFHQSHGASSFLLLC